MPAKKRRTSPRFLRAQPSSLLSSLRPPPPLQDYDGHDGRSSSSGDGSGTEEEDPSPAPGAARGASPPRTEKELWGRGGELPLPLDQPRITRSRSRSSGCGHPAAGPTARHRPPANRTGRCQSLHMVAERSSSDSDSRDARKVRRIDSLDFQTEVKEEEEEEEEGDDGGNHNWRKGKASRSLDIADDWVEKHAREPPRRVKKRRRLEDLDRVGTNHKEEEEEEEICGLSWSRKLKRLPRKKIAAAANYSICKMEGLSLHVDLADPLSKHCFLRSKSLLPFPFADSLDHCSRVCIGTSEHAHMAEALRPEEMLATKGNLDLAPQENQANRAEKRVKVIGIQTLEHAHMANALRLEEMLVVKGNSDLASQENQANHAEKRVKLVGIQTSERSHMAEALRAEDTLAVKGSSDLASQENRATHVQSVETHAMKGYSDLASQETEANNADKKRVALRGGRRRREFPKQSENLMENFQAVVDCRPPCTNACLLTSEEERNVDMAEALQSGEMHVMKGYSDLTSQETQANNAERKRVTLMGGRRHREFPKQSENPMENFRAVIDCRPPNTNACLLVSQHEEEERKSGMAEASQSVEMHAMKGYADLTLQETQANSAEIKRVKLMRGRRHREFPKQAENQMEGFRPAIDCRPPKTNACLLTSEKERNVDVAEALRSVEMHVMNGNLDLTLQDNQANCAEKRVRRNGGEGSDGEFPKQAENSTEEFRSVVDCRPPNTNACSLTSEEERNVDMAEALQSAEMHVMKGNSNLTLQENQANCAEKRVQLMEQAESPTEEFRSVIDCRLPNTALSHPHQEEERNADITEPLQSGEMHTIENQVNNVEKRVKSMDGGRRNSFCGEGGGGCSGEFSKQAKGDLDPKSQGMEVQENNAEGRQKLTGESPEKAGGPTEDLLLMGSDIVVKGNMDIESQEMEARANETEERLKLMDGRKCGLCGGGSSGEFPHELGSVKGKEEGRGQPDESERLQSLSIIEPGWLGQLLGPLDDRFGIAGVWVHQECAIWSPEVYFSGIGHMRNVRAALRRGRLLRCSRCGRPGATIGCRVDKCTRTYHLPCGYFEGCLFDHEKFLLACVEHALTILPQSSKRGGSSKNNLVHSKIQYQRMAAERKKEAQKALQRDLEAEEKWMESAGVDEEFIRREKKRLCRDLGRVAPVFVGRNTGRNISDGWETIAGLQSVVQCLKEMVIFPLLYPGAFKEAGISPPRGVLLHGYPGTGKTHIVKALVGACAKGDHRIAYFSRKGADCLGKYAGDAERQLRLLFHVAEQHEPAIIFFDEIDGLAPKRSYEHDQTHKSVVSTLLALMDGLRPRGAVVVIGATNRPDDLDSALRRPGRFDREIYFPLPSIRDRAAILALHTKKWETPPRKEILYSLARETPGHTGADLQALCAEAAMVAIRRAVPELHLMELWEGKNDITLPPLPGLRVRLSDWVVALKQSPLPCSHRLGKGAVYEVVDSLPGYMVPALLKPMVEVLVSLHLDPRVVLPTPLENSSKHICGVLDSTTEGCLLGSHWKRKLQTLCQSPFPSSSIKRSLYKAFEDALSANGMLFERNTGFQKLFERQHDTYTGSSFRIMLSGNPRNGQSLLAAWILHGFSGYTEILKISLTAMLQEGCGDVMQGLLTLMGEAKSIHPHVLYLPQIETWAVETTQFSDGQTQQVASQSWNLFVQQTSLMPVDLPIIILASCETQKGNLPSEIRKFFGEDQMPSLCCVPIPCAWVEMEMLVDTSAIFERAAQHYAFFFSQRLLSTEHSFSGSNEKHSGCERNFDMDSNRQFIYHGRLHLREESFGNHEKEDRERSNVCSGIHGALKDDIDGSTLALDHEQRDKQPKDEVIETNGMEGGGLRVVVPSMGSRQREICVAISSCGFQLLLHPELADLRHATSRLRKGLHVRLGKEKPFKYSAVTGLAAVGLLAFNGFYSTSIELASEVRKILDLLKRRVDVKIQQGKDEFLFFRILSQAAALDDKMFAWAHHLQSWEMGLGTYLREQGRRTGEQTEEASSGSEQNRPEATFAGSAVEHNSQVAAMEMEDYVADGDGFPLKIQKCCPQCVDEVTRAFEEIFRLLSGGNSQEFSTDNIHDVIGICVATVSSGLSRLLYTLKPEKANTGDLITRHTCLVGASCVRKNKCCIGLPERIIEVDHTAVFLCLCPLLKAISNMAQSKAG